MLPALESRPRRAVVEVTVVVAVLRTPAAEAGDAAVAAAVYTVTTTAIILIIRAVAVLGAVAIEKAGKAEERHPAFLTVGCCVILLCLSCFGVFC